jgi:hypothetical protein
MIDPGELGDGFGRIEVVDQTALGLVLKDGPVARRAVGKAHRRGVRAAQCC